MKKRHDWWCTPEPGQLRWRCQSCEDEHKLTAISAADPERLRSMLVVLEAPCRGTTAGRAIPVAAS